MRQIAKILGFGRDESGSAMIEFAVSSSILMMAIFGIMDLSRAMYADHYVSNVARDATRYAMVRGSTWKGASCATVSTFSCTATSANVTSFVQNATPLGFNAADLTVSTTWPGTTASGASCTSTGTDNAPGCVVQVKVSYSFNFVLPFLPKNTLVLTSTSSVAISQ